MPRRVNPSRNRGTSWALADAKRSRAEIETHPLTRCPVVKGVQTDTARLSEWIDQARGLTSALDDVIPAVADPALWQGTCQSLAKRSSGNVRNAITVFRRKHETWSERAAAFAQVVQASLDGMALTELLSSLQAIQKNKDYLQEWTRWVDIRRQASGAGLDSLILAVEEGRIKGDVEGGPSFFGPMPAWVVCRRQIDCAGPELRGFLCWDHEDAIKRFRELDDRVMEMATEQVLARIQHGLPARDAVPRKSELGTLRHQLSLQRPSKSIRDLISAMPDSFTKLAPCVLMSPLSVAQYLPPGQAAFDVVIFDEGVSDHHLGCHRCHCAGSAGDHRGGFQATAADQLFRAQRRW